MSLKNLLKTFKDTRILIPALDRHLLALNGERPGDGWIHPSGIHGCLMVQYMNMLKCPFEENIEPNLRRIFNNGDHVHLRLQKYLLDAKLIKRNKYDPVSKCEFPFINKKWRVRGTCDGLLTRRDAVLEIKSINQRGFSGLGGPKAEHLWQGHLYMWGHGLEEILFLYECKDNQNMKEFLVKFDAETFDTIFTRIKYLNRCYKRRTPPEKWTCGGLKGCQCNRDNLTVAGKKWYRKHIDA